MLETVFFFFCQLQEHKISFLGENGVQKLLKP